MKFDQSYLQTVDANSNCPSKILNCDINLKEKEKQVKPLEDKKSPRAKDKFSKIQVQPNSPYIYIANGEFGLVPLNVAIFIFGHLAFFYFFHYYLFVRGLNGMFVPVLINLFFSFLMGLGVTGGAHRLWSHKSYKAKLPLKIFYMICQTISGQNCLYVWCRDHRVHHKYSETDADPHNSKRGYFFAHVGWLLRKKHPEIILKSAKMDFSDLIADPVIKFQMDYYNELYFLLAFLLPTLLTYYFCGLTMYDAAGLFVVRYVLVLHSAWFVNSTAHMFGSQPYSKNQQARENPLVSYGALGEGYHNYHHTFPYDYKTAEDGAKINGTRAFIDLMAKIGQAYDLKEVSKETIEKAKAANLFHHH